MFLTLYHVFIHPNDKPNFRSLLDIGLRAAFDYNPFIWIRKTCCGSNIYNQRVLSIEVSRNLAIGSHMTENKNKVLFDTEREAV